MSADDLIKLLAAPDVERVEMRPDGTVIVEKRSATAVPVYVPTPYIEPWRGWPQPYITYSAGSLDGLSSTTDTLLFNVGEPS